MSAKEMFEKLGFKYSKEENFRISYVYENWRNRTIHFYLKDKDFSCNLIQNNAGIGGCMINMDLFKAIQQQIKELHWND